MKRSIKKFIALFMAICICCTSVEMKSFAVEGEIKNQVDNKVIDEINNEAVSSSIYKGQNISVDFIFYEKWDNGYTANFKIINNGEDSIDNWYLQFKFNDEIKNIWNGEIYSHIGNEYIIKNSGYNRDIPVGGSVEFGILIDNRFAEYPREYGLVGSLQEEDESYNVEYYLDCDWNTGFNGTIEIKNNSEKTIEDWNLEFDFCRDIINCWGCSILSHEGNRYTVKNAGYNANIKSDESVTFGFTGIGGTKDDSIYNI